MERNSFEESFFDELRSGQLFVGHFGEDLGGVGAVEGGEGESSAGQAEQLHR